MVWEKSDTTQDKVGTSHLCGVLEGVSHKNA